MRVKPFPTLRSGEILAVWLTMRFSKFLGIFSYDPLGWVFFLAFKPFLRVWIRIINMLIQPFTPPSPHTPTYCQLRELLSHSPILFLHSFLNFVRNAYLFSSLARSALFLEVKWGHLDSLLDRWCLALRESYLPVCLPFGHFAEHCTIKLSLDAGELRATRVDEGMDSYEDKALLV